MAYKNYFQPVRMQSVFNEGYLESVTVLDADGNDVKVLDGALVTIDDGFVQDDVYANAYTRAGGTAPEGMNVRKALLTTAATDDNLFIIDLPDVSTKTGNGGTIRDGVKTIGLEALEGAAVRARRLDLYDTFVIGSDNTAVLTKGQWATPGAGGKFVASATEPTSGVYFYVVDKFTVSQGVDGDTSANGGGVTSYRLDVKSLG